MLVELWRRGLDFLSDVSGSAFIAWLLFCILYTHYKVLRFFWDKITHECPCEQDGEDSDGKDA